MRSIYVRRRWDELLERAVELEAAQSGEEPSISRTVETAVRAYVERRETKPSTYQQDVEVVHEWLCERYGHPREREDEVVIGCRQMARDIAFRREELRDGGHVSDEDMAAYGWTEVDGEWQFTGLGTPRAVEARRGWGTPLAKQRVV